MFYVLPDYRWLRLAPEHGSSLEYQPVCTGEEWLSAELREAFKQADVDTGSSKTVKNTKTVGSGGYRKCMGSVCYMNNGDFFFPERLLKTQALPKHCQPLPQAPLEGIQSKRKTLYLQKYTIFS